MTTAEAQRHDFSDIDDEVISIRAQVQQGLDKWKVKAEDFGFFYLTAKG